MYFALAEYVQRTRTKAKIEITSTSLLVQKRERDES